MATDDGSAILQVEEVAKHFGNVVALEGASMEAKDGEITAIVGDNGAGKSTLIKCVAGVHLPDRGRIVFGGEVVRFSSPEEARRAGIETVYQNLALVDELTIWQNLFLNREIKRGVGPVSFLDRKAMARRSEEMLSRLDIHIPSVHARVRRLSGGQRQAVAISRATGWGSRLIVMDEPTAALGVKESGRVEELILRLREEGHSLLVISHNFDQVLRLSDQIWVMRQGRVVGGRRTSETTGDELVALVTGANRGEPDEEGEA
ncbi:MAG: hypothetical protein AVDCRST_MAG03-807 [uncultured Rubrobacteraceae bacterium]|uniref:ABC transporter domain-containing protein n=1 Tax=uncultured Rubrobacteraceae bacterium TaxID=349277 RepID=A0A6J4NWV3_9ACTN|nr:MAG: hypothetical protein AVDCRST_MAG03-807 [uncultured Rubrobacteraceae bacterium]